MNRLLSLGFSIVLLAGLGASFSSSTSFVQADPNICEGVDVGEAGANVSVNDSTISVEGLYCANTGGYTVVEESIEQESGAINAVITINSPREDRYVQQVIEPIEFEASDEFEDGNYDVNYEVILDEEVINSGTTNVQIGEPQSQSIMLRFRSWVAGIFR